jgi:hypothetical protein
MALRSSLRASTRSLSRVAAEQHGRAMVARRFTSCHSFPVPTALITSFRLGSDVCGNQADSSSIGRVGAVIKGPSRCPQPADRRSAQHAAVRPDEYLCIAVLPGECSLMPLVARPMACRSSWVRVERRRSGARSQRESGGRCPRQGRLPGSSVHVITGIRPDGPGARPVLQRSPGYAAAVLRRWRQADVEDIRPASRRPANIRSR